MTATLATEHHLVHRTGWLRAAVLGANDGILSTASLVVGIAAAGADKPAVLLTGVAGLAAGALSMAAGEYVSVSSQADTEATDTAREAAEIARNPDGERRELAGIWRARGLSAALADQVATELSEHDALGAHLRDELGLTDAGSPQPVQAALASASAFAAGGLPPVLVAMAAPRDWVGVAVGLATLALLAVLGALGASAGGADRGKGAARVVGLGVVAMAATALIGRLAGVHL